MVIFLIWVGLICCGVANGFIYECVNSPVRFYYMLGVVLVILALLAIHRIYTRNWYDPVDEIDEHHPRIFSSSTAISFIVAVITLLSAQACDAPWGLFIGAMTILVAFCIATVREFSYV